MKLACEKKISSKGHNRKLSLIVRLFRSTDAFPRSQSEKTKTALIFLARYLMLMLWFQVNLVQMLTSDS